VLLTLISSDENTAAIYPITV